MVRNQHIVLYDSDCPLCTFQMRLVTWLDWLNKVRLVPISEPEATGIAPELTRELRDRMVEGCNDIAGERHFEDMAAQRDREIVAVLRALREARLG